VLVAIDYFTKWMEVRKEVIEFVTEHIYYS
jgi:hypothetical protein